MSNVMMKRIILWGPILSCVAYVVARVAVGHGDPHHLYEIEGTIIEIIGGIGCIAAGLSFARGDHLRTAWIVYGAGFFALIYSAAYQPETRTTLHMSVRVVLTFIANATGVWALWLFSRTSRVAGLELAGTRRSRAVVYAIGVLFAAGAAGPAVVAGVREVVNEHRLQSFITIFSSGGDILSFMLLVPLFVTGYTLRGGRLAWVWFLLGAGVLGWLMLDAGDTIGLFFHAPTDDNPEWVHAMLEPARILGCILTVSAGLQQILLAREARAPSQSDVVVAAS
jgi:hypothetical protein